MSTRLEVRSVHESITYHHSITPLWCPSRLPHEKARHSTHTYLGKFYKYPFKLSNNQAKLSKQSITADTAIRIVLLTLQGCTTFTHMIITYRLCTRHRSRGASEDAHHNLYLTAHLVQESRLPGLVTTIVNPVGLPKWTQTMCAWCESWSRMSRSLTWLPGHKLTRNPNYCDIWTSKGMS